MNEKESQAEKVIGFSVPRDLIWKNILGGITNYLKRPSRKMFWYNLSTVIVLMAFSGYLAGKIQNHVNHHDLIIRGIPELEETKTTFNSITD